MTCPHCGSSVRAEDVYCPNCTRALRLAAPESPYHPAKANSARTVGWIVALGLFGLCALAAFPLVIVPAARKNMFGMSTPASAAAKTACLTNIKQLAVGAAIYQSDYDDRMFPSRTFMPVLMPYIKNTSVFYCPVTRQPYAVNKELLKFEMTKVKDPALTLMFYEGANQKLAFPHGSAGNVAFADTHAKVVGPTYVPKWKP